MSGGAIRLVVSDVDGTAVGPDKSVAPGTAAAAMGVRGACAGFNGGALVDGDGTVLEWNPAPAAAVRAALDLFAARGVDAWLFTADEWLIQDPDGAHVAHERHTIGFAARVVDDYAPFVDQVGKLVGVSADHARLAAVEAELQALLGDTATAHRSQEYYLDLTHRDANKGYAVRALARRLGVPLDQVAVLGDMVNDLPMFAVAGFSVAMGNASDAVKAQASASTGANDADGWAQAVDGLILPRAASRPVPA